MEKSDNQKKRVIRFIVLITALTGLMIVIHTIAAYQVRPQTFKNFLSPKQEELATKTAEDGTAGGNLFETKLKVMEQISKISWTRDISVTGLSGKQFARLSAPLILSEGYAPLSDDVKINGKTVPKPSAVITETFEDFPLSITALWLQLSEEQKGFEYWTHNLALAAPSFVRGNPDGSVSMFFIVSDSPKMSVELVAFQENVESAKMVVRSSNCSRIAPVIEQISSLCELRKPFRLLGFNWRTETSIPVSHTKEAIHAGLTSWYSLSDNFKSSVCEYLIDGNIVLWNNIICSMELIVRASDKERVMKLIREEQMMNFIRDAGEVQVSEKEYDSVVKITITDNFLINYSALWQRRGS